MNKIIDALLTKKHDDDAFYTMPIFYLAISILFGFMSNKALTDGVIYLKHSGPVSIESTSGSFMLIVQVSFCIAAGFIAFLKIKRNLQR